MNDVNRNKGAGATEFRFPKRRYLRALIASAGVAVALCTPGPAAPARAAEGPTNAFTPPQMSFAPLVARVKPAVVQISTRSRPAPPSGRGYPGSLGEFLRRYYGIPDGQAPVREGEGSGFIIDPTGYIATNNHVVDGAQEVTVTLMDGSKLNARVVGRDPLTDVALVKVEASHSLPFVAFGDSDAAREGDWVLSVGNPYGLGGTVTAGIISARGRNINEGPYDDFLQIDAPINPGNSGGPLFNQAGQVVGINTAIYSPSGGSVGIGFAVPSKIARSIIDQLRDHGRVTRGWLGISMQAVTPDIARAADIPDDGGVLVAEVTSGSPAAVAGLKSGDLITAYDHRPIKTMRDLAEAVAGTSAGRSVDLALMRDGRRLTIPVKIADLPPARTASLE